MALSALDLLAGVVAARAAGLGRLDALAVDHRRRGRGLAANPLAILHDQMVVDGREHALAAGFLSCAGLIVVGGEPAASKRSAGGKNGRHRCVREPEGRVGIDPCPGLAREAAARGLKVKVADLDIQQGTLVNRQRRRVAGLRCKTLVRSREGVKT